MPAVIQLTLITKPGCHLCDDARSVVQMVTAEFLSAHTGVAASVQISLEERNMLEDERLIELYSEEIPVLLIEGKVHAYWKVDPTRFRAALDEKLLGL